MAFWKGYEVGLQGLNLAVYLFSAAVVPVVAWTPGTCDGFQIFDAKSGRAAELLKQVEESCEQPRVKRKLIVDMESSPHLLHLHPWQCSQQWQGNSLPRSSLCPPALEGGFTSNHGLIISL